MNFPSLRPPAEKRSFTSPVIEEVLRTTQEKIANPQLAWLFNNCFPNTLDTTVSYSEEPNSGQPDTFIITGDIDAMWLRDSTNQIWPYLPYAKDCAKLKTMLRGLIRRQAACILLDPYANAFYKDPTRISPWKSDHTLMLPGIHERKYELDSLASFLRLAVGYYEHTQDPTPFNAHFLRALDLTLQTITHEQLGSSEQPYPLHYSFQRTTQSTTETLPLEGLGNPFRNCGLSRSPFRPSDDATLFQYHIPSNAMTAINLKKIVTILNTLIRAGNESPGAMLCGGGAPLSMPHVLPQDTLHTLATKSHQLATQINSELHSHALITHPTHGQLFAYEIDGYSSHHLMDDANLPNLLSLPYLGFCKIDDPLYQNTRRFSLSNDNPYFAAGSAVPEGALGGPHIGTSWVWPLGIITRAMTSTDDNEILQCLKTLASTHANKGFIHEAFQVNNPNRYTRDWFAWANTYFGELILHLAQSRPDLLAFNF